MDQGLDSTFFKINVNVRIKWTKWGFSAPPNPVGLKIIHVHAYRGGYVVARNLSTYIRKYIEFLFLQPTLRFVVVSNSLFTQRQELKRCLRLRARLNRRFKEVIKSQSTCVAFCLEVLYTCALQLPIDTKQVYCNGRISHYQLMSDTYLHIFS